MTSTQTAIPMQGLTPTQLAEQCGQSRPDNAHEPFCFELFRRAISEKSEECWGALYRQYQKLVYRWVVEYAKTNQAVGDTPLEELVADAFTSFWRAFTPVKLQNANRLNSVLSYLKSCAVTAVLQARRRTTYTVAQVSWDTQEEAMHSPPGRTGNPEPTVLQKTEAAHLWAIVNRCCNDERERIIARLSFVADLKPQAILEKHPDLFTDVADIYTTRRNLKNRLWRDEQLRTLWGEQKP
ncbi:MAG: hypothetical protein U0350_23005 [Caldilineaceae bacterium]